MADARVAAEAEAEAEAATLRVEALFVYPVKSMRAVALTEAKVEPIGLSGDRRWMAVDEAGIFLSQRECATLAQVEVGFEGDRLVLNHHRAGSVTLTVDPNRKRQSVRVWHDALMAAPATAEADAFVSAVTGKSARLVHLDDPAARPVDREFGGSADRVSFADGFPLLLTHTASLDDLNARLSQQVPMSRFRPNIVVGRAPAWEEDSWTELTLPEVSLKVVKPCGRCVITTHDQGSGEAPDGNEPLRTLSNFRRVKPYGVVFGQNLIPASPGVVRVGDEVHVTTAGSQVAVPAP